MKVSIAMTTYNGEKYIVEQLFSIFSQTRQCDELIVCDDCSKDNTVPLVTKFIEEHQLKNWKVIQNGSNLGWKRNFYQAISYCSGDLIFCCDQDDVWHNDKIEKFVCIFNLYSDIDVLAGCVNLIDSQGRKIKVKGFPFNGRNTGKLVKAEINTKFPYSIYPGCALAFRQSFFNNWKGNIDFDIPHDAFFWKIGILNGRSYVIDYSVIDYRIHENNASNPSALKKMNFKKLDTRIAESAMQSLQLSFFAKLSKNKIVANCNTFFQKRTDFLKKKCFFGLLAFSISHIFYYKNMKMAIGDLAAKVNK